MADVLYTGAQWAQAQRHSHATQDVLLGGVSLKATFNHSNSYVDQNGQKIDARYYSFIFRKSDITANSISLVRGTQLVYNGETYEIAYDRKVLVEDNDPFGLDIIIRTVKK